MFSDKQSNKDHESVKFFCGMPDKPTDKINYILIFWIFVVKKGIYTRIFSAVNLEQRLRNSIIFDNNNIVKNVVHPTDI